MKERKQKTLAKRLLVAMLSVMMAVTFIPTSLFAYAAEPEVAPDDVQKDAQTEVVQDEPTDTVQKDEPQTEATKAVKEEATKATEAQKKQEAKEDESNKTQYFKDLKTVRVDVSTEKDAFAEKVKLVVEPLEEDSDAFKDAEKALAKSEQVYSGILAYDIHFENGDGEEVEPQGAVSVEMKAKAEGLKDIVAEDFNADSVQVSHIVGKKAEVVADTFNKKKTGVEGMVEVDRTEKAVKSIDASFDVESFSTYVLTWGNNTATIHWGTYEGGTFKELADPTAIDTTQSSVKLDVIIDASKYYFVGAEYKTEESATDPGQNLKSTTIKKTSNGTWQMELEDAGTKPIENGSHIYVNYAPYGEGGYTPPPAPTSEVLAPETNKTVTSNGDGTYTIELDVLGKEDEDITQIGANVIVVMDITQSMTNSMPGSTTTRMAAAKQALRTLVNTLDPDTNRINFTAVNFGDSANYSNGVGWTTQKSTMLNYVNGLPDNPNDMGTCWQAGLQGGRDRVGTAPAGNETYVIFVTDGNPNCYTDDSGRWHRAQSANFNQQAYNAAVSNANWLGENSHFYGVFVGDAEGYTHLNNLISGADGEGTINGSTTSAVEEAFQGIAQTIIDNLGAGSVEVDDGIPTLSNVSANVSAGEAGGFEYYITPKGENQRVWADAPGASYSNSNGVTWNLSEAGTLKDGWTYTLKFTVWPSQAAYDLIADLNNGVKDYDDLTDEQKDSVKGSKEDGYTLKTNTHLYTTFKDLEGNEYRDVIDAKEKAMDLPTETINVTKVWNNPTDWHIGDDSGNGVNLWLTKDGKNYLDGNKSITVAPDSEDDLVWESTEDIYISCGQIVKHENNSYEVLESGHDYQIAEPPEFSYYWDLKSDIYHPMVINGTAHYLIQDDDVTGTEGQDYYILKGGDGENHRYVLRDGTNVLTAVNDRRSNLNLRKVIDDQSDDQGADRDTLFEYTAKINNSNAAKGKESDTHSDYYIWFSVYDPENTYREGTDAHLLDDETLETSNNVIAESGNTGYFYVPSGEEFTFKIKEGWGLRFLNVPVGTDYSIVETVEDEWEFKTAKGSAIKYEKDASGHAVQSTESYNINVDSETATIKGAIEKSNRSYSVEVTNQYKPEFVELTVNKAWEAPNTVTKHGDINVALFREGNDGKLTFINGSVRTIAAPETSVTYNKLSSLEGIVVREVTVDGDTVIPIDPNGNITVTGETVSGETKDNIYVVDYTEGTESNNARTDTVKNKWAKTSIGGTKTFTDDSWETLGVTHVIIQLYKVMKDAEGTVIEKVELEKVYAKVEKVDGQGKATYLFDNLDKYMEGGVEILYEVAETGVVQLKLDDEGNVVTEDGKPVVVKEFTEDYTSSVDKDNNITNTRNKGYLKITKELAEGSAQVTIPADTKFTITGPDDYNNGKKIKEITYKDFTNGVYTEQVPTGEYTVVEDTDTAKVSGYTLVSTTYSPESGKANVTKTSTEQNPATVAVKNKYTINSYSMTVVKTFSDIEASEVPKNFEVAVTKGEGESQTTIATLKTTDTDVQKSDDGLTFTWTVKNVDFKTKVTATESNEAVTGYVLKNTAVKSGNVTIGADESKNVIRLSNPYEPDKYDMTVVKTFSGIEKTEVPANFEVGVKSGDTTIATLKTTDTDVQKSDDGLTFTWTVEDVDYKTKVTATESNEAVTGYVLKDTAVKSGNVTIGADESENVIRLSNPYEPDEYDMTVVKTFKGIEKEEVPANFEVGVKSGDTTLATLKTTDTDVQKSDDGLTFTWKVKVPYKTDVTATETNYNVAGYSVKNEVRSETGQEAEGERPQLVEGITGNVKIPAADTARIEFMNTYTHVNVEIEKVIKKLVSFDGEIKNITFTFRVVGENDLGQERLNTIVGVEFNAATGETTTAKIEKIPADITKVTVTEIDSGNYSSSQIILDKPVTEENCTKTFKFKFENTLEQHDYESGIVNKYKKTDQGYVKDGGQE